MGLEEGIWLPWTWKVDLQFWEEGMMQGLCLPLSLVAHPSLERSLIWGLEQGLCLQPFLGCSPFFGKKLDMRLGTRPLSSTFPWLPMTPLVSGLMEGGKGGENIWCVSIWHPRKSHLCRPHGWMRWRHMEWWSGATWGVEVVPYGWHVDLQGLAQ